MVVVAFNYKLGLYGFLASEGVGEDGYLNAGVLDQMKALQLVRVYINMVRKFIYHSLVVY